MREVLNHEGHEGGCLNHEAHEEKRSLEIIKNLEFFVNFVPFVVKKLVFFVVRKG